MFTNRFSYILVLHEKIHPYNSIKLIIIITCSICLKQIVTKYMESFDEKNFVRDFVGCF